MSATTPADRTTTSSPTTEGTPLAPPIDTSAGHPTAVTTVSAWLRLAVPAVVANLVIYVVAGALGVDFVADTGAATTDIGPLAVAMLTAGALLSSTVVWAVIAHRSHGFASLWVPLGWGVGLVSLAMILGVSGVAASIALGAMHVVTTIAAAHVLPRLLPRTA